MKLGVELDSQIVAPGEELSGRVRVLEGGRSRSLSLTVSFCERSPVFLVAGFSETSTLFEGDLVGGQQVEFRYRLPDWARPGVEGKHSELFWQLEAVSDEPGLDTRASQRFQVVSQGR